MSDIMRKPDCAEDLATLGGCVLTELLALIEGIRALSKDEFGRLHVAGLVNLASRHAAEWADHFSEQVELIREAKAREGGEA